ncbi:MAG: hypothetical protein ACI9HE_003657 [Planctomycetota bacterium]|jgi:hypothetical protein
MDAPVRFLTILAGLTLTASLATAQNWQDDFDSYAAGSAIEGQGGWMNWAGAASNQTINTVSSNFAHSGSKSVRIDTGSDTVQPFNLTSGKWVVTAHMYIPTGFDGVTMFIMLNTFATPAGPYNWSQEVHYDAQADTILFRGGGGTTLNGLTYDAWTELRHEIDLDLDTCDVYYEGALVNSFTWSQGVSGAGATELAVIDLYPATANTTEVYWDSMSVTQVFGGLGSNYCGPAVLNSTGQPSVISAAGSVLAVDNDVTLTCSQMPQNEFAFFLNSLTQGFVANPGASQGNLCLVGSIGRYNANILNSGTIGEVSLVLDLPNTPIPTGTAAIMAGETWNFQCWHRDLNPVPTSNFSDGLSITFQ